MQAQRNLYLLIDISKKKKKRKSFVYNLWYGVNLKEKLVYTYFYLQHHDSRFFLEHDFLFDVKVWIKCIAKN